MHGGQRKCLHKFLVAANIENFEIPVFEHFFFETLAFEIVGYAQFHPRFLRKFYVRKYHTKAVFCPRVVLEIYLFFV